MTPNVVTEKQLSVIINYFNPSANTRVAAMLRYACECYAANSSLLGELIVVDGSGITDPDLRSLCESRDWIYTACPSKGAFAKIYNQGMRLAKFPYRAWSASDIFVCEGWDHKLISELNRTGAWMAAPYLTNSDYIAQTRLWPVAMRTFSASYMTFNLNVVTAECVSKVGLMDERFSGNYNDVDYLLRIRSHKKKAIIVNAGQILHVARGTSSVSSTFNLEADRRAFVEKYPALHTTRQGWHFDMAHRSLHDTRIYPALLRLVGSRFRASNWLAKLEPLIHRI